MALNFSPLCGHVDPDVMAAMVRPPASEQTFFCEHILEKGKDLLFPTAESACFFSAVREDLCEIVLNSFVQKSVLFSVNGPFSQQWLLIAKAAGLETAGFDTVFGHELNMERFRQKLGSADYDAVCLVEVDPFTGVVTDVSACAELIRECLPDALIIVDCTGSISCLKAINLKIDADVIFAGSEGVLGIPPGLGIVASGVRADLRTRIMSGKRWSLDYYQRIQQEEGKGLYPFLPYPLLNALSKQLDNIIIEGVKERITRIEDNGRKMRNWAASHNFVLLAGQDVSSPTVTVMRCKGKFSPEDLRDFLIHYGIIVGNCPDELNEDYFVVSHTWKNASADMELFFEALDRFITDYDTHIGS